MFNQNNMAGKECPDEIKEIEKCPFKVAGAKNRQTGEELEPSVVCLKAVDNVVARSADRVPHMACVGEGTCPDMQTHRAVMKLLKTL